MHIAVVTTRLQAPTIRARNLYFRVRVNNADVSATAYATSTELQHSCVGASDDVLHTENNYSFED